MVFLLVSMAPGPPVRTLSGWQCLGQPAGSGFWNYIESNQLLWWGKSGSISDGVEIRGQINGEMWKLPNYMATSIIYDPWQPNIKKMCTTELHTSVAKGNMPLGRITSYNSLFLKGEFQRTQSAKSSRRCNLTHQGKYWPCPQYSWLTHEHVGMIGLCISNECRR